MRCFLKVNMFNFRNDDLAKKMIDDLKQKKLNLRFMHICGTHQYTLVKSGLDTLFKKIGIEVREGPGCPVCITTAKEIEKIKLLATHGKTIATFGDMINVPGQKKSLGDMQADGYDIRTVYGIEDAISIAEKNRDKDVVFMAIGFETTAPTTATAILNGLPSNFYIFSCHRLIPPALQAIMEMGEIRVDGFIDPGHVSTIIGTKPYEFISEQYKIPQVVAGFEPLDLIMAVWMLVRQIEKNEPKVENEYKRAVKEEGNEKAIKYMKTVFMADDMSWRGFPIIKKSALKLERKFEEHDAEKQFEDLLAELNEKNFPEPKGCRCSEVLRGLAIPQDCPLFGKVCNPSSPIGPCMVSIEGSCNIEYRYGKKNTNPYGISEEA